MTVSWGPGWLCKDRFLPCGHRHSSPPNPALPSSLLPSFWLKLGVKLCSPEPSHPPRLPPASVSRVSRVLSGAVCQERPGEKKGVRRGPYLAAAGAGDSCGAPCLPAPLIAAPAQLAQLPGRPWRTPSASSRPAPRGSYCPAAASSWPRCAPHRTSRETLGCARRHGHPRVCPESLGAIGRNEKSSRSRQKLRCDCGARTSLLGPFFLAAGTLPGRGGSLERAGPGTASLLVLGVQTRGLSWTSAGRCSRGSQPRRQSTPGVKGSGPRCTQRPSWGVGADLGHSCSGAREPAS